MRPKNKKMICLSTLVISCLSGCSNLDTKEKPPVDSYDQRALGFGSLLDDGGIIFGRTENTSGSPKLGANANVNLYLWRASLDTFTFAPILVSDPVGGIIATDWFSTNNKNERTKVNIKIDSTSLRADALTITIFKQRFQQNRWINIQSDSEIAYDLETVILNRAKNLNLKNQ